MGFILMRCGSINGLMVGFRFNEVAARQYARAEEGAVVHYLIAPSQVYLGGIRESLVGVGCTLFEYGVCDRH